MTARTAVWLAGGATGFLRDAIGPAPGGGWCARKQRRKIHQTRPKLSRCARHQDLTAPARAASASSWGRRNCWSTGRSPAWWPRPQRPRRGPAGCRGGEVRDVAAPAWLPVSSRPWSRHRCSAGRGRSSSAASRTRARSSRPPWSATRPPPSPTRARAHPRRGGQGQGAADRADHSRRQVVRCAKISRADERIDFVRAEFRRLGRKADQGSVRALIDAVGTRPQRAGRRLCPAGRRRHRHHRPADGGQVLPGPGGGDRVQRGRPRGRGPARRRAGTAPLGAGHRGGAGADQQRAGPGGPRRWARSARCRAARAARRWPGSSACRPGRSTGSGASSTAGPPMEWPARCRRWPKRMPRSRAKEPARAMPWNAPSRHRGLPDRAEHRGAGRTGSAGCGHRHPPGRGR